MDTYEADKFTNGSYTKQMSYRVHILSRRASIQGERDLSERIGAVLTCMKDLGLDLPILLSALSWGNEFLTVDGEARYHRSVLMNSIELPEIVQRWYTRSETARSSLSPWATECVTTLVNKEMDTAVERLRCDRDDFAEDTFLSITPASMKSMLKPEVPTLWRVLKSASRTSQQEKRNKDGSEKVRALV